ncbi:MAG: GIY-YIG nuclease family protein [Phycisphaeraceae bacterium]|nr:GIY-YIG nuclease family protein [Phycisphaeraceae bacterium]
MQPQEFFPPRPGASPTIYAYASTHPDHKGLLKVGYTERNAAARIAEQFPAGMTPYTIALVDSAMRADGTSFTDRDVHRHLLAKKLRRETNEWFRCTVKDVQAAILAVRERTANREDRTLSFDMRPEQAEAVQITAEYFTKAATEQKGRTPHFLWNAKMRFGKTFAAYQLAKKMGWTKVLVLTFKPAVVHAWAEDLNRHIDFEGWQFISRTNDLTYEEADPNRPIVCFGSFQDYLQRDRTGAIKAKNEWVHLTEWDCVILDEYHFGAWRENAKGLFGADEEDEGEVAAEISKDEQAFDESILPIETKHYLYLSGTPFRALASGEFIEEQIYNWTYSDEQRAKRDWKGPGPNPYASLPRLVLMTYTLPDEIRQVAEMGEFNEFDLNEFFRAEGEGDTAAFVHLNEVQKWLDLIRGAYKGLTVDDLKLGKDKPPLPFSDARLMGVLNHTFWFLPNVASCHAMANLLRAKQNLFYHDYAVVVAAGASAGIGAEALPPVLEAMDDPLNSKTITLSCGKLTTGVTVRPWAGMLVLRKCSSPETYFQSAFRVQSPWTTCDESGNEIIVKPECYVFDFAPNRALRQIADYGSRLATDESTPEQRVADLVGFLPVLAYDGSAMRQLDAEAILDMATAGTSATLLAKRWESVLLVNVDDGTLNRLMTDEAAMAAIANIEGFRNLNAGELFETIINRSEQIKDTKRKLGEGEDVPETDKRQLTEAEKERKTLRKQVQEKLIKFAARIPVFMYLTDYREQRLKDVITKIEPKLFQKVTGLTTADFERLVSLGVFNSALMNDAVWKFRRYEDASLRYMGVERHRPLDIGLWDTALSEDDFKSTFEGLVEE